MQSTFEHTLESRPDPLRILKTSAFVLQHARHVKFNMGAVERAADALAQRHVEPPAWNYAYHFFDGSPRTVNYLFLLDTLNFCFWGKPRWTIEYRGKTLDGYWALAASLKRAAEENPSVLDADFLAQISPGDLAHILHGKGTIPLFTERWRKVRELGAVLRDRFGGSAARLVESAQGDAALLARIIAESFSSFNDVAVYHLTESPRRRVPASPSPHVSVSEVRFFKRAQILVTDLWGSFGGKQWGEFRNMDTLTAFADYKLPQILRAWGVLKYSRSLARKIDSQTELPEGSEEEIEIRAATLWAVEFLRQSLAERGRELMSIQVDWILWEASQAKNLAKVWKPSQGSIKPYHRVRSIYY